MKAKQNRSRTIPFRILAAIQWGSHPWVARRAFKDGTGLEVRVLTGKASRALRVSRGTFVEQLEWLQERGLLLQLSLGYGRAQAIIPFPSFWNWDTIEWGRRSSKKDPLSGEESNRIG